MTFWPLIWGSSPYFLISNERSSDIELIFFNKCLEILYCSWAIWKEHFKARPLNSLSGPIQHNFEGWILFKTSFSALSFPYFFKKNIFVFFEKHVLVQMIKVIDLWPFKTPNYVKIKSIFRINGLITVW